MFLLLLPSSFAQIAPTSPQTNFTIYGRVNLPNGEPASRVIVKIASASGLDRQVFTDDMGRYEVRDLPRGRYFLTGINPAATNQFTDAVEADTARSMSGRLLIHIYFRIRTEPGKPDIPDSPVVSLKEFAQEVPKEAKKFFEQGRQQSAKGQLDRALKSFSRSIEIFPAYFQARAERGHLLIAQGQPAEAAREFDQALEINPHYEPSLRGSGYCKFQEGKFAESVEYLERAIALESDVAMSHLFLGVARLALGHIQLAEAALKDALRLDATASARARVHLANLYLQQNQLEKAAEELRTYLAAVPNAPDAAKLRALEEQLRSKIKE